MEKSDKIKELLTKYLNLNIKISKAEYPLDVIYITQATVIIIQIAKVLSTKIENKYEKACKEFLKGCSCADEDKQEQCLECLKAFCDHIRELGEKDGYKKVNEHCVMSEKTRLKHLLHEIIKEDFNTGGRIRNLIKR